MNTDLRQLRIGFLGAGNMARAIASGLVTKGGVAPEHIIASDISPRAAQTFTESTGARTLDSNVDVVRNCDLLVIAVKPFHVEALCDEIADHLQHGQLVVSICAGIPTAFLERRLGPRCRVVRAMPNTPALIGCGATAVAPGQRATSEDVSLVCELFRAVGVALPLAEGHLDVVTGLSGSGPAYVFYFAQALIDAAAVLGLPRDAAEMLVLQTLYGASRMALETGDTLDQLRAAVTTKGGTTEAGLRALESAGFAKIVEQCVRAAAQRSSELAPR